MEGKMKKNLLFIFSFLMVFLQFFPLVSALEPGKTVPGLRAEKWYNKSKEERKNLQVIVLLDITAADSFALMRMLENVCLSSLGKSLSVTVFLMNEENTADRMMKEAGKFSFSIALDSRLKMRNALAEHISLFPYAILAENSVVQWQGMPTELELVVEKVLKGTFSLEKQKKVEGLRKELQIAIQSGLPVVVSSTADKILSVLPDDRLAIQSKLFALNAMQQKEEAEKFIEKICIKNPGDVRLQIMQLDFLLREGKLDAFVKNVEKRGNALKESKDLLLFVSFVLENAPFGVLLPQKILALAFSAYENIWHGKEQRSPLQKAVAAEVYARTLSQVGRLEEAVEIQKKALEIRKGSEWEKDALRRLLYYQDALAGTFVKEKNKKK